MEIKRYLLGILFALMLPMTVHAEEITDEEKELLARICVAEAEAECEEGQRFVIDTILNRVDSDDYPDSIKAVIFQKGQFTCTVNGRLDRIEVIDEVVELVEEEIYARTNYDCLYFQGGGYHKFAEPIAKIGNHYFSKPKDDKKEI